MYDSLTKDEKESFRKSAGWKIRKYRSKSYLIPSNDKIFIQQDSKGSIEEDFANHIEYYLFKPKKLKTDSPKTYKWIKNKFGKYFKLRNTK